MVTFNLSYTAPINPPDTDVILTKSQIWTCMQQKVRRAEQFVSAIEKTEVLSESVSGGVVLLQRRLTFAPGGHPAGARHAEETCKFYEPCRVDFLAADGSVVTNVVSLGPSGREDDLHYTYVFEWRHPGVEAGSEAAARQAEADWKVAKIAVNSTIKTIRRLVKEGVVK
ncbi:hypothetical protein GE09DRAFT_1146254 [Coniochaeta sp. 2T2.1]|nr:hypothetical protein GE09DRAFT_1146254 [Coniochaeta sp. 2T2.1]